MKALNLKSEIVGSGLLMCAASYLFYAIDPMARSEILVEKLLKIACYCMILLSFNLWMRVNNRLKGLDPEGPKEIKAHIKMTLFFLFCFALMEAALFLEAM